jgi:hypothetical protein
MTFWFMIKMMIHNLMNKSFNIFDSHELNNFLRICHALMTLISFFRKSRSLHFNRFLNDCYCLEIVDSEFSDFLWCWWYDENAEIFFDRDFDDQNCWIWKLVDFDVVSKIHENQLISHFDLLCLILERIFQSRYFE